MTPAQRLAQALYDSHGPDMVAAARDYMARLDMAGYAIVPVDATEPMVRASRYAWTTGVNYPQLPAIRHAAAVRAFQQEISAE